MSLRLVGLIRLTSVLCLPDHLKCGIGNVISLNLTKLKGMMYTAYMGGRKCIKLRITMARQGDSFVPPILSPITLDGLFLFFFLGGSIE